MCGVCASCSAVFVVDHQVPLPVAQALLGRASLQTTAG
jgi:hypothetical protein